MDRSLLQRCLRVDALKKLLQKVSLNLGSCLVLLQHVGMARVCLQMGKTPSAAAAATARFAEEVAKRDAAALLASAAVQQSAMTRQQPERHPE